MNALIAFIGFALLVIFHELGHFFAAKAVGMRVERFALFFPPLLAKVKRGETEYAIGAIPLGGYVKITGMSPDEELPPELKARSYSGSPVWKRIFVIAAGPVVNLVLAFLILAGIFWHEGKPIPDLRVAAVEQGQAAEGKLEDGDRILAVRGPSGEGDAVATVRGYSPQIDAAEMQERTQRIIATIGRAGCGASVRCADPAPVTLEVDRAGQTERVTLTPKYDEQLKRSRVGVAFSTGDEREAIGPLESSQSAVTGMWEVTKLTVTTLSKVVYDSEARSETSSVVGGFEATRQSLDVSTMQALWILAYISLSLAIINLFPFLPLDGGHIFWAIVEKLRGGRPVSTAVLERASMVGLALVLMLFAVGFTNDIGRITSGEGFGIR